MSLPLHQCASTPLVAGPEQAQERLLADPEGLVQQATADARAVLGPQSHLWGLPATQFPSAGAHVVGSDQIGYLEVTWGGPEDATGWPSLTGQLVIAPEGGGTARLRFLTSRSPQGELATGRVGRFHRRRVVRVAIQRFLYELAQRLDDPLPRPVPGQASRSSQAPMFVHHIREFDGPSGPARDRLVSELGELAEHATAEAITGAQERLAAGRFRGPAAPVVQARLARPDEPACAWVGWRSDEESTGWPRMELALLLGAHAGGTKLVVLSTREPNYDLSRLRIDKQQRDQILRTAGPAVGDAIVDAIGAGTTARAVMIRTADVRPSSAVAEASRRLPSSRDGRQIVEHGTFRSSCNGTVAR